MTEASLWERIEPLLPAVEKPSRYLNHEYNAVAAASSGADFRAALLYPDTYELGQSNQAIGILYQMINALDGCVAERTFLPWVDMIALMRADGIPLFTLESARPVASFDLLGITLPHELAATNILEALDLAGIPLHASERTHQDPLVVGGGPGAFNPEPLAPFFDAFVIGEGEEVIAEVIATLRGQTPAAAATPADPEVTPAAAPADFEATPAAAPADPRTAQLKALAAIEGVYVPSLYERNEAGVLCPRVPEAPASIKKRVVANFDACPIVIGPVVPFAEVAHDRLTIEILRGCSRGCRFCQAGMMYRPVRERRADTIVDAVARGLVATGFDEVSLTSLSTTDHSQIEQILRRLNHLLSGTGIGLSIPSQRLDAFGIEMARLIAGEKKAGLTFAPEAGTQRLRDIINKNVTEDNLLEAVAQAYAAGWQRCKLYFMIGLPGECDEDVQGIAALANRAYEVAKNTVEPRRRNAVRMGVSVAIFVPKSHTPFQWKGQIARPEVERRIALLKTSGLHRGISLHWHDPATSRIEAALSRAGREAAALIEEAWRRGALFDAWSERFSAQRWDDAAEACGQSIAQAAEREYVPGEPLPWSHINSGVSQDFLLRELELSRAGITSEDCSFTACVDCGVCPACDVEVVLGGACRE